MTLKRSAFLWSTIAAGAVAVVGGIESPVLAKAAQEQQIEPLPFRGLVRVPLAPSAFARSLPLPLSYLASCIITTGPSDETYHITKSRYAAPVEVSLRQAWDFLNTHHKDEQNYGLVACTRFTKHNAKHNHLFLSYLYFSERIYKNQIEGNFSILPASLIKNPSI